MDDSGTSSYLLGFGVNNPHATYPTQVGTFATSHPSSCSVSETVQNVNHPQPNLFPA